MRVLSARALLIAAAGLAGCAAEEVGEAPGAVAHVESGDLVVLENGTRVRYAGVSAPEPGHPLAEESRLANERLVLGRKLSLIEATDPGRDQEGREEIVAFAYAPILEGQKTRYLFVQGELAYFGLVGPEDPPAGARRLDLFEDVKRLSETASSRGLGIWERQDRQTTGE